MFNIREQGNLARVLGGEGTATIVQNERRETMPAYDKDDIQRRMHGAVEALKHDLGGLRTGRASTTLLDPIQVEVYGANMPLNQVATVSAPEPRMLSVQVWDKSLVGAGREGDPQCRPRLQSDHRRHRYPPADPGSDRGAPQGAGQARRINMPRRRRSRSATSAATAWTR